MRTLAELQERIRADAVARLGEPNGGNPANDIARHKAFIKVVAHRIHLAHRADGGGLAVACALSFMMDELIRHLFEASKASLSPQARKEFPPMALVALGGYGRGELCPRSDIDIMFLHDGQVVAGSKPLPSLARLIEGIYYPLINLNIKVGQCVRTVADCVQVANTDMQTKTSLIEARFITGDPRLFEKFQKAVETKCVKGHEDEYIAQRIEDQKTRREKFGNSPTMQEPNLKNGCGGLRDYQNLLWMAWFKYGTRTLDEIEKRGAITAGERKQLVAAYDFILRVRHELHYQVNRPVDALSKSLQPPVALKLGYAERSPVQRIERFMRDLYTHFRRLYLITRTIEERLALQPKASRLNDLRQFISAPFRKAAPPAPVDGFLFAQGQIRAADRQVFKTQPRRLMRVFLYAQQRGLKLHPDLVQLIREDLPLVKKSFLLDEHVRATFLEILNQRGSVSRILRAMHEVGLLGKYVPEFGKLTNLVQHEFYHQYAADEHTLVCIEKLDGLWESTVPGLSHYADIFQSIERPFVLYLALLLHDSGKAENFGKHATVGGRYAASVARRLELDGATTHSLRLLIENHLAMSGVSQRRDLEDPSVIRQFAAVVQTPENLRMLTLHTVADTLATSDKMWNGFKDLLLTQLYRKTSTHLQQGAEFLRVEEKQRELLAEEIRGLLPASVELDEVAAHFEKLPGRYFEIHPAKEIAIDIQLAHRFMRRVIDSDGEEALEPIVQWHAEPDRGYTSAKVCTWDRAGLFSTLAGSFSAAGINILSAQIFTRTDGVVLDTFFVTDARVGGPVSKEERERFESVVGRALTMHLVDFSALIARARPSRPLYQSLEGERIPTRLHCDTEPSARRTVIDLETEDRLGLLYVVSKVLSKLGVDIALAKISTEKGAAIDTFYVQENFGPKETDKHALSEDRQRQVLDALRGALAAME